MMRHFKLARAAGHMPAVFLAAALCAVLGLALLGYGFLLRPGQAPYSPASDFVAFGLATKTALYESLRAGRGLPFWRNDEYSGVAAMADPTNAYTCPLNAPFWLWPPVKAFGPALWLHFLAAGLVGWACGWALRAGPWARLLMAAALMFNFKLIIAAYAGWLPSWAVVLPLLFAAVLRAVENPGAAGALTVGLAGALGLHSGHIQLFYYSSLFLACFAAVRAVLRARQGDARAATRELATLAAGAALATGLGACILLPLAADAPLLSRGRSSYDFFLSGHALTPRHLLTFLNPEALGTPLNASYPHGELWEDVAYFGAIPLALALAAALSAWRRPLVRLLAAGFIASVALALRSPLQRLLFTALPGFGLFRLPGRFLFLSGWFGIALAGLGLDEILRRLRGRLRRPLRRFAAAALIAAVTFEGSSYARRYLTMVPQERLLPEAGLRDFFAARKGVYRVVPIERSVLNYGWAAPLGLQLATGYGSYNYSRYQAYCDLLRWNRPRSEGARVWTDIPVISRPDMLDALNARYLVSPRALKLPRERFVLSAHLRDQPFFALYRGMSRGDMYIYENRLALPRAFFVDRAIPAASPGEAVSLATRTDLRAAAVVESSLRPAQEGGAADDRVETVAARGGALEARTSARGTRYLVVSEVWNPGWRATLDGRDLKLYKTDVALLGAWIPRGNHRLALRFRPVGWDLGVALTALGAVLCLVLLGLGRCSIFTL